MGKKAKATGCFSLTGTGSPFAMYSVKVEPYDIRGATLWEHPVEGKKSSPQPSGRGCVGETWGGGSGLRVASPIPSLLCATHAWFLVVWCGVLWYMVV